MAPSDRPSHSDGRDPDIVVAMRTADNNERGILVVTCIAGTDDWIVIGALRAVISNPCRAHSPYGILRPSWLSLHCAVRRGWTLQTQHPVDSYANLDRH